MVGIMPSELLRPARFGMDRDAFEARHADAVDTWEAGEMTIDEYLDFAVFDVARAFSRDAFKKFMFAQSVPTRESLDLAAVAGGNAPLSHDDDEQRIGGAA